MRAARRLLGTTLVFALLGASACCGGRGPSALDAAPPPDYADVRAAYNARTELLERVWARAVVEFRWTDDDGGRRFVQGDGYLQVIQPGRFALSLGKFGEVLYWMGAAGERYWFIDRNDGATAFIGSHDAIAQLENSPLPAGPRELLVLSGLTPLPESDDALVERRGGLVIVEPDAPGARYRYELRPPAYLPERITLLDARGRPFLDAEISDHKRVEVKGVTDDPEMAANIDITHAATGGSIRLALEQAADRSPAGPIRDRTFDFDWIVDRFGPLEVVDVDRALEDG